MTTAAISDAEAALVELGDRLRRHLYGLPTDQVEVIAGGGRWTVVRVSGRVVVDAQGAFTVAEAHRLGDALRSVGRCAVHPEAT